eukprot:gene8000-9844_t
MDQQQQQQQNPQSPILTTSTDLMNHYFNSSNILSSNNTSSPPMNHHTTTTTTTSNINYDQQQSNQQTLPSNLLKQDTTSIFFNDSDWSLSRGNSFSNVNNTTSNSNNNNLLRRSNTNSFSDVPPLQSQSSFSTLLMTMNDLQRQQTLSTLLTSNNNSSTTTTTTTINNPYINSNNNNNNNSLDQQPQLILQPQTHHQSSRFFESNQSGFGSFNLPNTGGNIGGGGFHDISSSPYSNNQTMTTPPNVDDDEQEVSTPPTPPVEPVTWGVGSSTSSNSSSFFSQPSTLNAILNQLSNNANNSISLPRGNIGNPYGSIEIATTPAPSEYETPNKFQRTGTLTEEALQRLRGDPDYNISFLEEQTSRMRQSVNIETTAFPSTRNRSFVMAHYETGCIPISAEFYNNLVLRYNQRKDQFQNAKDKQAKAFQANDMEAANELHVLYTTYKKDIDQENGELKNLLNIRILEPSDLNQIREILENLKSHSRIVDCLHKELGFFLNKKKPECCAAIVILNQPTSQVIFRGGKGISEVFKVQLVSGVITPENISTVTATIDKSDSSTSTTKKEKASGQPSLENAESPLNQQFETEFKNLKINISTRMTPSHLKFTTFYKEKNGKNSKPIESVPSNPMVVITNESQWAEAAGKLLICDAFGDKDEISWELFANILHSHLLTATNQCSEVKRKLHSWEFEYIQKNYFGSKLSITKQETKHFWTKFGPILQTIHFKRHILPLWSGGLIYGLITKNECNNYLMTLPEGSFLIRFSDSLPGSFAVAYVTNDDNERVKHYLIKPEDIGANKSLPDFLRERYQFKVLYRVDPTKRSLHPKDKDTAFAEFYKKTKTPQMGNPGYVSGL